jgi:hypothetical protein
MMNRTQQILAAVLVVQIVLSAIVLWPRAATGGIESLFPDLEAESIVAMTITDDQGKAIELRQVMGEWVLPEADDYAAKADNITSVVDKIAGLTTQRLVTRTDASHKRLQVAANDFLRRVDLETGDGAEHTLYLGSSPSYGTSHVRVDGRDETYLTNDLTQWDLNATPSSWVDVAYFSVPQDEISQVTLENANGTFEFTKDDQGNWTLADLVVPEQLDTAEISSLISRVTSVTMLRPLGKEELAEYGMDDPSAVVTLKKDGETITLLVGAQDPADSSYVVKVSTSPYYVRVGDYNARALVENTRADFLQPPPTPTPES